MQHDACDITNEILVNLDEDLSQIDNHFINENFSLNFKSKTCCQSCYKQLEHTEKLYIIPIPFIQNAEINESLKVFFETCFSKSLCRGCNTHSMIKKELEIIKLPKILIFQLQKAENLKFQHKFPSQNLSLDFLREKRNDHTFYDLYAVCVYRSYTKNLGHYYSYIKKNNGKWYKFDDDREIQEISLKEIYQDRVYLLFYEQVD